jgi:hypothetical protein
LSFGIDCETESHIRYGEPARYGAEAHQNEVSHVKILLLSALLVSSALPALAADNASLTGKWKIHISVAGNESDRDCTLTQKDDAISGTCSGGEKKEVQVTGKVDGTKVNWSYESEYEGSPITVKYSAQLNVIDGKFAGTVYVDPYGVDGDFTAVAEK